jgi:hypothetical protein
LHELWGEGRGVDAREEHHPAVLIRCLVERHERGDCHDREVAVVEEAAIADSRAQRLQREALSSSGPRKGRERTELDGRRRNRLNAQVGYAASMQP